MRGQSFRRHLSFANICAALALFLALSGGVAWAATQLTKNSVRAKHIAAKQVRAKHIAPGAIKARHLAKSLRGGGGGGTGLRGPQGPRGPKGDPGPAGPKGSADGALMGKGPLSRYEATGIPYAEIPLGSVNEFTIYGRCMALPGPQTQAEIHIQTSAGGSVVIGGTGNSGGANFVVPGSMKLFEAKTEAGISKRFSQFAATVISVNGEIHDLRAIVYVQRSDALSPLLTAGPACGINQVSILKASR